MQRSRAGVDGSDAVGRHTLIMGKIGLEPGDLWAGAKPARTQAVDNFGNLLVTDERGTKNKKLFCAIA